MIRIMIKTTLLLGALGPCVAFGWGSEGHRITGYMAQEMLTPKARLIATQLLDGGDLADASVYMDVYREALKTEVPGSERWHYNNRPVCDDASTNACADGNCASVQIPRQYAILADTTKTKVERQQALRFLVHMVGDIHQPLHAADDNDLGGNRKQVFMPGAMFPRNLHAVWDSDFVKLATRGRAEPEVAKDLIKSFQKNFTTWLRGDVNLWMNASYDHAKRIVYGRLPVFSCGEIDGKKAGLFEGKPWPETAYNLPLEYSKGATGIMPFLLAQAGSRIGGMLNRALDPIYVPPSETSAPTLDEKPSAPAPASEGK